MKYYENESCIGCSEKFKRGDEIVVCPECGDPYHKECFEKIEHCKHENLHGEYEYTNNRLKALEHMNNRENCKREEVLDKQECSFCQKLNDSDAESCTNCGMPFSADVGNLFFGKSKVIGKGELDGINIKDWIAFLGQNALSYILKFHAISKKKYSIIRFNISAFLFQEVYFFYRKMYSTGILFFLIKLLGTSLIYFSFMPEALRNEVFNLFNSAVLGFITLDFTLFFDIENKFNIWISSTPQILNSMLIFNFILSYIMGFLASRIYRRVCIKRIKSVEKNIYKNEEDYRNVLAQKGSVNHVLAMVLACIEFLIIF